MFNFNMQYLLLPPASRISSRGQQSQIYHTNEHTRPSEPGMEKINPWRGSTLGQWGRQSPSPNLDLALPKCDIKHSITNSKHQHIGAKAAFCGHQNAFPAGLRSRPRWGVHNTLDPIVGWRIPFPMPYFSAQQGASPSNIFF